MCLIFLPDRNLHLMTTLRAPLTRSFTLFCVAGVLLVSPALLAAQSAKPTPPPATPAASSPGEPDRSSAYYHYGLAHLYEEMAVSAGRPDYATQAVEEYKLALNAGIPTPPCCRMVLLNFIPDRPRSGCHQHGQGADQAQPERCRGAHASGPDLRSLARRHARSAVQPSASTRHRRI